MGSVQMLELTKTTNELENILNVVLAFNSINDKTKLLNIILTNMMELTDSDAGTLYLKEDNYLHFKIMHNKSLKMYEVFNSEAPLLPPIELNPNSIENISAYSAINNEVVLIDDVYTDKRFNFCGTKKYDALTGYNTKSMFVFPICSERDDGDDILGVLQLINPIDKNTNEITTYNDYPNKSLVIALAKIAANTLSGLAHVSELQAFLRSFAAALTHAVDERSRYNGRHTQNVAIYCEQFTQYLSSRFPEKHKYHFNSFHAESLTLAALLHDIGKIVTPLAIMDKSTRLDNKIETILNRFQVKWLRLRVNYLEQKISETEYNTAMEDSRNMLKFIEEVNVAGFLSDEKIEMVEKLRDVEYEDGFGKTVRLFDPRDIDSLSIRRGTLTAQERTIMEDHVITTKKMLDKVPFRKYYSNVPHWAGAHHEFLDGTGYPNRISGDEIPIEACIITIMDIFDALIDNNRPYKKGVPIDRALEILQEMANEGKLHKELLDLFIESKIWESVERF